MSLEQSGHYSIEHFFIALALILIFSKVFGELAERIKQPSVLGELVAGIILGGSVLAVVPSVAG
ncbi:MAG: cation:proton antiporter, partial [Thermodesulfobacteriota bacterium]